MAYVKILYQDSPSTATPLNAQNLNHMDDQIAENDRRLNELATAGVVNTFNGRTGNVTSEKGDYDITQIAPTNGATAGQIPILVNNGTEEDPDLEFAMQDIPSSGHVIKDQSGTDLAQEDALQFADSFVSDDSINGRTIVENIKEVDPADYDSTTDEGIIVTDDGNDALIGPASDDKVEVEADGVKTWQTLLNELYALIDSDKINPNMTFASNDGQRNYLHTCQFIRPDSNSLNFTRVDPDGKTLGIINIRSSSSSIKSYKVDTDTTTDSSSSVVPNGYKLSIYYGNRKATVDLQTTANRCLMSDGSTVQATVDDKLNKSGENSLGLVSDWVYTDNDFSSLPLHIRTNENNLNKRAGIGFYTKGAPYSGMLFLGGDGKLYFKFSDGVDVVIAQHP